MKNLTTPALTAVLILLTGCGGSESDSNTSASADAVTTPTNASWVLASAPEGAVSVSEAKAGAKEGDEIVIHGRIGGRRNPMDASSPVFTIVDLGLEYCGQTHDDGCRTPWDYCCETPETITSNSATVQIVSDGTIDLTSALEPLDEVILRGTVAPRPDEQVLTIRATGVYAIDG